MGWGRKDEPTIKPTQTAFAQPTEKPVETSSMAVEQVAAQEVSLPDGKPKEFALNQAEFISASKQPSSSQSALRADLKAEKARNEKEEEVEQLRLNIHRRLIEELDISNLDQLTPDELKKQIRQVVGELLVEEKGLISTTEKERLIDDILNETMGYGPIEPLLRDDSISEVMVNGPKQVIIERKGKLVLTDVKFKDDKHLLMIIDRIVSKVGRRVDETTPLCDARLPDGSRVNAIIPPLAIDGCSLTIRKFRKDPLKIEDLVKFGSLTPMAAEFLKACVWGHMNVIISGGTGSGKTTLLNVTSGFIPNDERIVTIEDAAELQLQQEHVVRLETRPPNVEGKGAISMRDLLKNSLRMRPDRIVIGEVRSGEALDMLQAMNTGHDGSLATLHANTPRDALRRLETLVLMAGYDLPQRAIREQVASAIHLIIQTNRLKDGSRKITHITEVTGMEGEMILLQDIFHFVQKGVDENHKIVGNFEYSGVRPKCLDKLLASGADLDPKIFEVY